MLHFCKSVTNVLDMHKIRNFDLTTAFTDTYIAFYKDKPENTQKFKKIVYLFKTTINGEMEHVQKRNLKYTKKPKVKR